MDKQDVYDILVYKSMSVAERKSADAYAGPGTSFPLYVSGKHLKAAWNLAGHSADKSAIRAKVKAFAAAHGLTGMLPDTAHEEGSVKKASNEAHQGIIRAMYAHAEQAGDEEAMNTIIDHAHMHGATHLLPESAHSRLHERDVPHNHEGQTAPSDDSVQGLMGGAGHTHPVVKAYNPVGKSGGMVVKAWGDDDSCTYEGWMSTDTEDIQHDIILPEAFTESLDGYFARRAPVSYEHNQKSLPAGHLQKAAIVRDGKILKEVCHPTDSQDFENFPGTGNGVYVRGVLNTPEVAKAVKSGNVGGMSFIGNGHTSTPRFPKGVVYNKIYPLYETTVAAYPVNMDAVITVAKAYGLEPQKEIDIPMSNAKLDAFLKGLLDEEPVQKSDVTLEALEALLTTKLTAMSAEVDTKIQKAITLVREEGVGTKAPVIKSVLPEENPLHAIVMKARKGEELSEEDKDLIGATTSAILSQGMQDGGSDKIVDWVRGL